MSYLCIMPSVRRRVFFSFHYERDVWRAAQIRNMGVVEGNEPFSDNAWEEVKQGGDAAIERWVRQQMDGRTCCVVLIGTETAHRKWVLREIEIAWEMGLGVVGIYIHNLKDAEGLLSRKGANPFEKLLWMEDTYGNNRKNMDLVVKDYNPRGYSSNEVYAYIKERIADWIEEAIEIRQKQGGYVRLRFHRS